VGLAIGESDNSYPVVVNCGRHNRDRIGFGTERLGPRGVPATAKPRHEQATAPQRTLAGPRGVRSGALDGPSLLNCSSHLTRRLGHHRGTRNDAALHRLAMIELFGGGMKGGWVRREPTGKVPCCIARSRPWMCPPSSKFSQPDGSRASPARPWCSGCGSRPSPLPSAPAACGCASPDR